MKILYDFQIFTQQRFGGISRYFNELINKLPSKNDCEIDIGFKYSENFYLNNSEAGKLLENPPDLSAINEYKNFLHGFHFKGKGRLFNLVRKLRNRETCDFSKVNFNSSNENISVTLQKVISGDYDILHPTYYDPYFLEHIDNKPYVITVFDFIHEIFPEYFPLSDPTSIYKKKILGKASKLIAISEQTKMDLIKFYEIPEDKVDVVYLSASLTKEHTSEVKLPDKFIFYVGGRLQYKNFYFLIRAVQKFIKKHQEFYIVCCGGGSFTEEERQYFKEIGINSKIIHLSPSDKELSYIYQRANVFVYPSLYEGFGIPVIEAFRTGAPTLLSNTPCFKEVAKDNVFYFEPKSIKSLVDSLEKAVFDKSERQKKVNSAYKRAKDFSWERTVKETIKVYQSIL
ncbi:glycosyltransferase [Candidatus Dojkabacteria bacterium]|nr:glycosyltransferase [Candidatus Dojkabacteria bacterium]